MIVSGSGFPFQVLGFWPDSILDMDFQNPSGSGLGSSFNFVCWVWVRIFENSLRIWLVDIATYNDDSQEKNPSEVTLWNIFGGFRAHNLDDKTFYSQYF